MTCAHCLMKSLSFDFPLPCDQFTNVIQFLSFIVICHHFQLFSFSYFNFLKWYPSQPWLDPLFFLEKKFRFSLHFIHFFLGFNLLSMILFYPTCIYYCQTQLSQSFHLSQPICYPMFNFHGFQLFSVTPLLRFNFLGFSNMFKIQEFFCHIQISYYVRDV